MVRIFWKVLQSAPPPPKVWREYLLNENNEYYFTLIAMFGMWQWIKSMSYINTNSNFNSKQKTTHSTKVF
jgi:hypothetical protein